MFHTVSVMGHYRAIKEKDLELCHPDCSVPCHWLLFSQVLCNSACPLFHFAGGWGWGCCVLLCSHMAFTLMLMGGGSLRRRQKQKAVNSSASLSFFPLGLYEYFMICSQVLCFCGHMQQIHVALHETWWFR